MSDFADRWKKIKTTFESNTGKKKPSETFAKAFRVSSGVEKALKKVDDLVAANDWEALVVAHKDFTKAETAYIETAKKSANKDPKYQDLGTEINAMINGLRKIGDDISDLAKKNSGDIEFTPEELIGKANWALMCKGVAKDAAVTAFTQQKVYVNAATGQQDKALLDEMAAFSKHYQTYLKTLSDVQSLKGRQAKRTELIKYLKQCVSTMQDAAHKNGMLGRLVNYTLYQKEALRSANKPTDHVLIKLVAKASGPLNTEFDNLTKVESFLDNIKG